MKALTAPTLAHLGQKTTTLSSCWKLTRRDNSVFGFTDADRDITVDGVHFVARAGYTKSAIASNASLAVDNLEIQGILSDESVTEADMLAGVWDFAEVRIFMVNRFDATQKIKQRRGWLGNVILRNNRFVAELRGLTQVLQSTVGELYSPSCRADFGDNRCKFNLAPVTTTASATGITSARAFAASSLTAADGYYDGGKVTFTSGLNIGLAMEVKFYTVGNLILQLPMPYAIGIGDSFSVRPGCDKSLAKCIFYGNIINMRAEPFIPGMDRMTKVGGGA